jgi:hypothetical protein
MKTLRLIKFMLFESDFNSRIHWWSLVVSIISLIFAIGTLIYTLR